VTVEQSSDRVQVAVAGPPEFVERLRAELADAGFLLVVGCTNRAEVLATLQAGRAEVFVVDRDLDGGGLSTTAAIARRRRPPSVVVVGSGSPDERRAARLAGASGYLSRKRATTTVAAMVSDLARTQTRPRREQ
jgi:DNA-binding NarL/FixJ family response regulator